MLTLCMMGFMFVVFLLETVVLAANDWKVSRKTPVYDFVYELKNGSVSFCELFWVTFFTYCILFAVTLVASVFLVGFFDIWAKWGTGLVLGTGLLTMVVLLFTSVALLFVLCIATEDWLQYKYQKFKYNSYDREPSQLSKGISNWYSQVKDKFCPIVTKEKED